MFVHTDLLSSELLWRGDSGCRITARTVFGKPCLFCDWIIGTKQTFWRSQIF